MKKNIVVTLLLLFIACLAACSSFAVPEASITVIPSLTAVSETLSPTSTPTFAATFTPGLDSLRATMSSELATIWAPVYATLDSRGVKCDDGYKLEVPEVIDRVSNVTWSIFTCSPIPENREIMWTPGAVDYGSRYTKLLRTDLSQSWTISHRDFSWSNRPDAYLSVRWWTQDGNFVYLVPVISQSGCGYSPQAYFLDGETLYRLNLNSGEFEVVLPSLTGSYAYSLSPNGKYLAYSMTDEPRLIHIRNFANNSEQQITLDGDYVLSGAFVWEVNSQELIFAAARNGWDIGEAGTSIFRLNVPNMELHTLVFNDPRLLVPSPHWDGEKYVWINENIIYLTSLNDRAEYFLSEFTLGIWSGDIINFPTPTLWPTRTSTPTP